MGDRKALYNNFVILGCRGFWPCRRGESRERAQVLLPVRGFRHSYKNALTR